MSQTVVSARNVGKTYQVFSQPWDRLRELVTGRTCHLDVHALADISFELAAGESLGIVGENGAGKSTLLSILSGVTSPSGGEFSVQGKVASLLELGMGFHPELSGHQNIFLNAAMMGLSETETQEKVPEIISFSELGEFIDRPVKTYSTGMTMRLGFAVAVQVEPDVLIIDEALSVGDGYFQKKCMDRIREFVDSGRTLLFCSHAMYYVSHLCPRAIWLRGGRAEAFGPVDEVVHAYENYLAAKADTEAEVDEIELGPAKITSIRFVDREPEGGGARFAPAERWQLEVAWRVDSPAHQTHLGVSINTINHVQVCSFSTHQDGEPSFTGSLDYRARLEIPRLPLNKGEFSLYVYILDESGLHIYDQEYLPAAFSVASPSYRFGLMQIAHTWARSSEHGGRDQEPRPEPTKISR
ncbi:MAG: ABC transporter ATP-binding protein [bacterium]|nr:ABC transporter ATP-binding protein [bacterium]